jgi:hypothetical protein
MGWRILVNVIPRPLARDKILISANPCYNSQHILASMIYLRNNSWKPYVYIVFTTGRPLCHEVLPRALARGKKLT